MTQPPVPGPPPTTGGTTPQPPGAPTAAIDYAVARLAELDNLDLAEHPARFDAVHATLTDALNAIDRV
jgi:hypothetical protein